MIYQMILEYPESAFQDVGQVYKREAQIERKFARYVQVDGHDIGQGVTRIFLHTNNPHTVFNDMKRAGYLRVEKQMQSVTIRKFSNDEIAVLWKRSDG